MFRNSRFLTRLFVVGVVFAAMHAGRSVAQPLISNKQDAHADQKPVLYVIGTSHLDSQWNWTVQDSIRRFIPNTFFENFQRFEKYPDYKFNYEGAIHYMWFKEYHPEMWPTVQKYVADGRWRLSGSWINAVDVNVPSSESLMRQALYGKWFQRHEFGKVSQDVYLPDCFGFGFALPSIATHSGLKAFTTQKLTWGSSYGIPFPVGRWKGVDGNAVVAALNPGDYVTRVRSDVSTDPKWSNDLTTLSTGRKVGLRLFGVGDIGGAPDDESVNWIEKALANKNGTVEVRNTSNDQLSKDLTDAEIASLPEYEGELTMKTHGVGCYTSQAAMKRFNRENEKLAQSAEQAAVAAELLTGLPYPKERLRQAWIRVLWHQFHDDLTGTCIPMAYQFSWNDELVSLNQFAGVLTSSTSAISSQLDTRPSAGGVPIVVYNPLSSERNDPVEATVDFGGAVPDAIRVIDHTTMRDVPVQIVDRQASRVRIVFLARMPAIGFKVFEVARSASAPATRPYVKVTDSTLDNARYAVRIDANGDIASVIDKLTEQELLKSPVRLEMRDDPSPDKPAWRILWDTVNAPVREYVKGPEIRVVEQGPVRATLEITRHAAGSTIVQRVSLTEGGDRVDVENLIDWRSPNTLLKASFNLASGNPKATYDLGLGTIQRGNNTPDHYEVPAQKWADMTDPTGDFGTAILNDSKYGWDKPADDVLRLTLLHTPRPGAWPRPFYQAGQDIGHHRFVYSIAGHRSNWRDGRVPMRAAELNYPLIAFQTASHAGILGRAFSLISLSGNGQVAVRALKKNEDSDEIVVRLQEQYGWSAHVRLTTRNNLVSAREVNAAEETVGPMSLKGGGLDLDFKPYQPRTLALRFKSRSLSTPIPSAPLDLPFNLDGVSANSNRRDGDFDGKGQTLAAELLPPKIELNGVSFKFGPTTPTAKNVVVPRGQKITIPPGKYNKLYVIADAVGGDVDAPFMGPMSPHSKIRDWQGPVGQWYSQLKSPHMLQESFVPELTGQTWTERAIRAEMVTQFDPATGVLNGIDQIRPAFLKRDEIAWVGSHRHSPAGDQVYVPSYLFGYVIDLPPGAREITLPNDERLRILAISAFQDRYTAWPTLPLYANDLPEPASQTGL